MPVQVTVHGVVRADGTLEVNEKLSMSAGPVQVTVQPLPSQTRPERFWKMMESIWADLKASGRPARTKEEIDAEINALRDEAEEEMQAIDRLHDESRQAKKSAKSQKPAGE